MIVESTTKRLVMDFPNKETMDRFSNWVIEHLYKGEAEVVSFKDHHHNIPLKDTYIFHAKN